MVATGGDRGRSAADVARLVGLGMRRTRWPETEILGRRWSFWCSHEEEGVDEMGRWGCSLHPSPSLFIGSGAGIEAPRAGTDDRIKIRYNGAQNFWDICAEGSVGDRVIISSEIKGIR